MTPRSRARSSTCRAIGPTHVMSSIPVARVGGHRPVSGVRPTVGRMPTVPQKCDGARIEPPPSVPIPAIDASAPSSAASPPDEPPGVWAPSSGCSVHPMSRLSVSKEHEHSGAFVLATTTAPAARRRATTVASPSARWPVRASDPAAVRQPATSRTSLTVSGRPSRTASSPDARRASAASAAARASWSRRSATALSAATSSRRARVSSTSSRALTSRARSRASHSPAEGLPAVTRRPPRRRAPCGRP